MKPRCPHGRDSRRRRLTRSAFSGTTRVGFFDGGDLKKVAVTGQPVVPLCRNLGNPQGGTWGEDGTIVIASVGSIGLRRVSEEGGEATELTRIDAAHAGHMTPSMLPGGRAVLFTKFSRALDDRRIAVLDLGSGQVTDLLPGIAAEYLDTGHLLYLTYSGRADQHVFGTLWIVAFDLDRLALRGEPMRVTDTLQVDIEQGANFAVSSSGSTPVMKMELPHTAGEECPSGRSTFQAMPGASGRKVTGRRSSARLTPAALGPRNPHSREHP
jgi:hypothetical protein